MPELPEVETTCRGVRPHLVGRIVAGLTVREARLRWPVPAALKCLEGHRIEAVERRAKYLLIRSQLGTAIVHLGMSGNLRVSEPTLELRKHDHVLLDLDSGLQLRYHDPRRFGAWLWTETDPYEHSLLKSLGPEPFGEDFNVDCLQQACKGRQRSIKETIMDAKVVVGVGNIYACEALFMAGIHPGRAAGKVSRPRLKRLVDAIREVLASSIEQGGTTLRDFLREDGSPGYFRQQLRVYGRSGEVCRRCESPVKQITLGQRSTFYCERCQR
ncbi:MAG: bifunctional DNA-formamidopyrimidine glycosylase/DNA-(apurinic or apyrimidinic site) lyase [Opitutales bacterium]|nr:bifunctional DNA-formamidopyrimidine glycosylase/DNA-(apurinic or apyrimidinic site) lyase [Opitutales bacterium]